MYAPEPAPVPFKINRLGVMMRPAPHEPREAWGVLNPATARGRDGQLYMLPRIVAEGNFSRIALARVRFADDGNPVGVDRLGVVLEPARAVRVGATRAGRLRRPPRDLRPGARPLRDAVQRPEQSRPTHRRGDIV